MALARTEEIGPTYDLLIATRDGSTLACKNKDGNTINLSQLAFMTSVSAQNQQHEETELQHKDQLIQLSSPNLIDREFDQWPQVTQGDWSGGTLQRVLSGSTPITTFGATSDPTRYWDGQGVLWPTSDYLPQQSVLPAAISDAGGVMRGITGIGTTAGFVNSVGESYAFVYMQNGAPNNIILVIQSSLTRNTLTNPAGPWSAGNPNAPADFFISFGVLWYWWTDGGGTLNIDFVTVGGPTVTAFATIANAAVNGPGATGQVGTQRYLAVPYNLSGGASNVRIYNITTGTNTSFVDVPIGDNSTVLSTSAQAQVTSMCFAGDTLLISLSVGADSFIVQYSLPSTTSSVVAHFPNEFSNYAAQVVGNAFVISNPSFGALPNLYLLQGGSLQNIGPLAMQAGIQAAASPTGVSRPETFGPYAIFAVAYVVQGIATAFINVYAYDVLRGRLFKVITLSGLDSAIGGNINGKRLGVFPRVTRPFGGLNVTMQWGILVPTLSGVSSAQNVSNVQECFIGVTQSTTMPALQSGVDIISSLIDFTSAQLKLFRQILVTWSQPGLPNDSGISVTLSVWMDQDPASLNAVPDFTTTVTGGVATQGQSQLKLTINRIAHKLVYRVTVTGPTTVPTSAVKLVSVVIRAATGWTRTHILDLADNVAVNSNKTDMCWDRQSQPGTPAIDGTAAYNFLRQLWRLQGGEVAATFPNGDSTANWLLQDLHFDSPKPFGVSMRADQKSSLGFLATVKMREDV